MDSHETANNFSNASNKDLTIFIGLREISGYYTNLSRGLRDLGYRVIFVGGGLHPFRYGSDVETDALPIMPRIYENLLVARRDAKRFRAIQLPLLNILIELQQLCMFVWSLFTCDAYIFGYAYTFIKGGYDLPILKFLSKRVIVNIGHGSEARPPYIDGSLRRSDGSWGNLKRLRNKSKIISKRTKLIERFSSSIVASPYTSQFLTKPAVDFFALGIPVKPRLKTFDSETPIGETVKILHAPSKPIAKGSEEIKRVIKSLKGQGFDIEYIEVTNKTNSEVLTLLQQCDIVVDQLYSDSTITGIAYEAAEFAKPTIVAGYGLRHVAAYSSAMAEPPTIKCGPDDFAETLIYYIKNTKARIEAGNKAHHFVMQKWNRQRVAERFAKLIRSTIDPDWIFNPRDINYISGCALEINDLRHILKQYTAAYTEAALELDHRPDLRTAIKQLISADHNSAHSTFD